MRIFNLVRFYALTSLVVLASSFVVVLIYRHLEVERLIALAERHNETLAKPIANIIWPRFESHIASATRLNADTLRSRSETQEISDLLDQVAVGISTLKIKLYNADGVTAYSTESSEIGDNQDQNPGFLAAVSTKRPISTLTLRNSENEFERKIQNRDVVESYLPIVASGGKTLGVFELYTDVTPFWAAIERSSWNLAAGFIVFYGLIFGSLWIVVRRADETIRRQYGDIEKKNTTLIQEISERKALEHALEQARDELERKVADRSSKLVQAMTDRKAAEDEARRHRDELARVSAIRNLGEMATTLAHEINQPLAVISGWTQLCIKKLCEDKQHGSEVLRYVRSIAKEAGRASQVVTRLRALVQPQEEKRELIEIGAIIDGVSDLLRFEANEKETELSFELSHDLPPVCGDPVQIQQVILNLAHNAMESMSKIPPSRRHVTIRSLEREPGIVETAVCDEGPGIDADIVSRVFEPFFTTKTSGLGMGLAISRTIIESHGGRLWCESNCDSGTGFHFTLPGVRQDGPEPN